jgi:hypothetical protein
MFGLNIVAFIISTILLNRGLLGDIAQEFFVEPVIEDKILAHQIRADIPTITWKRFSDINDLSFDIPADWTTREMTPKQREEYYGQGKFNYVLFVDAGRYGTALRIASPILYNRDYWGSTSFSYLEPQFIEKVEINGKEFLKCEYCNQGITHMYVFFGEHRIYQFEFSQGLYLHHESQKAFNEIADKVMKSVVIEE